MRLYIKTSFDTQVRKLNAEKISLSFKNDDMINLKDFKEFLDIEENGILSIKVNPLEGNRWFNAIPKEAQDANFIIVFDGGWLSIPGKTVQFLYMEK